MRFTVNSNKNRPCVLPWIVCYFFARTVIKINVIGRIMQNRCIKSIVFLGALWALVWPVHAEIYKWVDKDGTIKYTDTPPPTGAKSLGTLRKKVAPSPTTTVAPDNADNAVKVPAQTNSVAGQTDEDTKALEKKKREIEEVEKRNKAEKEAQAKQKQLNCSAARSNYQSYSQGGRIYKTNENGERVYLGDKELADGAAQAKREIEEYCN